MAALTYKCPICGENFEDDFDQTAHELDHPASDQKALSLSQENQGPRSGNSVSADPQRIVVVQEVPGCSKRNVDNLSQHSVIESEMGDGLPPIKFPRLNLSEAIDQPTVLLAPISYENECFVFFDLETGGLFPGSSEILEIAAATDDDRFHIYVRPTKPIPTEATKINKLSYSDNGLLYLDREVKSVNIRDALLAFFHWLKMIKFKTGRELFLVAHSVNFDASFLMFYSKQTYLDRMFKQLVTGFIDTLSMSQKAFDDIQKHSLQFLVKRYLRRELLHTAKSDVEHLQKFFLHNLRRKIGDCFDYSCSTHFFFKLYPDRMSYKTLIERKILSWMTVGSLAKAGFNLEQLMDIFKKSGERGIKEIFQETVENGKPLITYSKTVLSGLVNYLNSRITFGQNGKGGKM